MSVEHALTAELNTSENGGDIIPSVAIDLIIAQRTAGITAFMEGLEKLREAERLFAAAADKDWFSGLDEIVNAGRRCHKEDEIEAIRRRVARSVDTSIWTRLMTGTGMFTLMSSKQYDKWTEQVYSAECPEVTMDNVMSTFLYLNASKKDTFETGIIDVFRNLSWDYETNNPCRLGKKIIIDGVLSVNVARTRYASVRTTAQNWINDLARAFWLLDKRNVPDSRVAEGSQYRDFINETSYTLNGVFICEWFTIKSFWKGSAHVNFTRPDLVKKINDIVASRFPGVLPPRV
ncbi:DUF4942 domain-containing protein [Klebsiella quasipneumoniae]|uniref:DUF4942 domain-containing protein n=1 Tax=Klebsiella quasipneumoniae TaxID=1463165 RepID=UPI0015DC3C83|nr:DUF4942 domain-containing protein [Klebsiella quasipneumoniae]BBS49777.1 hypothetical protein WP5S18E05_P10610 [Klebsiella quasipneumoniae]